MSFLYFGLLVVNVMLGVAGQTFIKFGVNKIGEFEVAQARHFFVQSFTSPLILFGIVLYGLSTFLWLILLSKVPLSIAYPMLSLGYVFILFISAFLLHEHVSWVNIAGVLLICGGVVLVVK